MDAELEYLIKKRDDLYNEEGNETQIEIINEKIWRLLNVEKRQSTNAPINER